MKQIAETFRTIYNSHDADALVKLFPDDVALAAPFLSEHLKGEPLKAPQGEIPLTGREVLLTEVAVSNKP